MDSHPLIHHATMLLSQLLVEADEAHDIYHALKVLHHVIRALKEEEALPINKTLSICLAALLHDADDPKLFQTKNNENSRQILQEIKYHCECNGRDVELVIEMINLVSCSKNKDSSAPAEWMLLPRYADRLEAIGQIGILRCYQYTKHVGNKLFLPETPYFNDRAELEKYSEKCYATYTRGSKV